jgi:hypothetical protein
MMTQRALSVTQQAHPGCGVRQVLAKSCKMIPVMVMGLVLGKRYTQTKYMCVGVITAGVFLFMMKVR